MPRAGACNAVPRAKHAARSALAVRPAYPARDRGVNALTDMMTSPMACSADDNRSSRDGPIRTVARVPGHDSGGFTAQRHQDHEERVMFLPAVDA